MAGEVKLKFLTCFIFSLSMQKIHSDLVSCDSHISQNLQYFMSDQRMTWQNAESFCKDKNWTLVELMLPSYTKSALDCSKRLNTYNEPFWLAGTSNVGNFTYDQKNVEITFPPLPGDTGSNTSCLMMKCYKDAEKNQCEYMYTKNCSNEDEELFVCRSTANSWRKFNIFISNKTAGWYHARNLCGKKFGGQGDLFFLDKEENLIDFALGGNLTANTPYYIGARRLHWRWKESGKPIVLGNWTSNQPNETGPSCLIGISSGYLDDVPCDKKYRAFCVRQKPVSSVTPESPYSKSSDDTPTYSTTVAIIGMQESRPTGLWIGVGVAVAVCLVIFVTIAVVCYKRKSRKASDSKTSRSASDQFHYLNSTLESQKPSIYANDPTAPPPIVENDIYKASQYETIDNLNLGGSTGGSTGVSSRPGGDTNIPSPPDVTMRQKAQNQNGTSRNDVYSQVIKKKPSQKENQANEYPNASVIQETSTDKKFDIANGINESDFDNDDHDIIDNEIYKFY